MRLRLRVETLALRYGRQDGAWVFPSGDRPVVVVGPNGSGKSTLVDGLARTLYGFDRRRAGDTTELEARTPWDGAEMGGRVVVRRNEDRIEIQRAFGSDRVRVRDLDSDVELFDGDGNPAARNQEAVRYREIVADLVGLPDLEAYRRTLLIGQGELADTSLGQHLLRVAAGGHRLVHGARRTLAADHRAITRRPLRAGANAAINPRELERLDEEIRNVEDRLEEARAARDRRGPLVLDRDRIVARLEELDGRVELLEDAVSSLARAGATEQSTRHLRRHVTRLGDAAGAVDSAVRELEAARAAERDASPDGRYPDDLPERVARAEARWHDLDELGGVPAVPVLVAGAVGLAAAAVLLALGRPTWAAGAAAGAAVAWAAWTALWLWVRRRRAAVREDLGRILDAVPSAASLGPDSAPAAVAAFRAQQAAAARRRAARGALADAVREARAAIRSTVAEADTAAWSPGTDGEASTTDGPPEDGPQPADRYRRLAARCRLASEDLRERLARNRLELDRIGDVSLALPDGVPPTDDAVAEALRASRTERAEVMEEYQDVVQELMERGAPGESVDALEARLRSLRSRRDGLERKARVLEAAHALVVDAYDAFRDRDQARLVERISGHVGRMVGGVDGVTTDDGLEDARVRIGDRRLPMATPPLSFGEYHALQLAVRLGAADFLAGVGIVPPLIVDEPFAHLDRERAAAVWRQLVEVAADRQVLVTTQETALLEHLGVEADIRLA